MKMSKLIFWMLALMSFTLRQLGAYNYEITIKVVCCVIDLIVILRILSYLISIGCFENDYTTMKKSRYHYDNVINR